MTKRPIFIPSNKSEAFVEKKEIDFSWSAGFAKIQKQKSIKSLHEKAKQKFNLKKIPVSFDTRILRKRFQFSLVNC